MAAPGGGAVALAVLGSPQRMLALGWILVIAAWVGGNPPFAGTDEEWHYTRAIGVGQGQFLGTPAPDAGIGGNALQIAWTNQATRAIDVPKGLAPPSAGCYIFDSRQPATCLDEFRQPEGPSEVVTTAGTYQPLPYLLPALAMKAGHTPTAALVLGRVATALTGIAFLLVALALLWDGAALSLLGLVLTVTPMVLFSISLLNGSAVEIAAAIAFSASLIRLSRRGDPPGRLAWVALGASGFALALSRSASPLWLVLIALGFVGLAGWRTALEVVRRGRVTAGLAVGGVLLGVVLNRVWEAAYGPDLMLGVANARHTLGPAFREWWRASIDLVGTFGYLEVSVPLAAAVVWFGVVLTVAVLAFRLGTRRDRVAIALCGAVALVLPPAFWLVQLRHTGFSLQGRHVLPLMVALPLLFGEVLNRRARPGRVPDWVVPAAIAATAVIQLIGWLVVARRSAVGTDGPLFFIGDAQWSPAGGWLPWIVVAVLGTTTLIAAAFGARRRAAPG